MVGILTSIKLKKFKVRNELVDIVGVIVMSVKAALEAYLTPSE